MNSGFADRVSLELLQSYAAGKRDFSKINLVGTDLLGADLLGVNLTKADLRRANLMLAYLIKANLTMPTYPALSSMALCSIRQI
jgi:uncharacterized protein YjbI with pentapeptide repeats